MNKRLILTTALCLTVAGGWTLLAQSDEADRVQAAATVFDEVMGMPDKAIPNAILEKAEAIAVFPGTLKGGLGIGVHRGKGIISTRNRPAGTWSNPGFLTLTGGSFGAQIGAQEIDLVLVVMNKNGVQNLMRNEFKIGADAAVAAGPVGRGAEAATDIQLRAEILSYSRARGLFAGVTLNGSAVREDEDANQRFYGRAVRNQDVLAPAPATVGTTGAAKPPEAVAAWHQMLGKYVK
jgi:lipid-binding SYLF domain-containing protein